MSMEQQVDRAVESATDQAHDAYSVTGEAPFVYDKESWADCIADIVTDPETDEELRQIIRGALVWMDECSGLVHVDADLSITIGASIGRHCQTLGELILKTAIKNGVTLANIGKVD